MKTLQEQKIAVFADGLIAKASKLAGLRCATSSGLFSRLLTICKILNLLK